MKATDRAACGRICFQTAMLLRLLNSQRGESAITIAVTIGTLASMGWLILLLTEVDLRPGLAAFTELTGHLRQQVQTLIGLS